MKKIFLILSIFSLFTFSSCEKISNPFQNLSEWDKKISAEFLEEKTYQWNLDLSWLWLTQIPDFPKYLTWSRADEVTSISLNANEISKIDWEKFENFLNLKELNLSFNNIKNTEWIEKIPSQLLWKLELTKSWVEKIEWISELKNLRELYLSFNNIENVEWLENLTNLNYLELAHNQLTNIDNLSNLDELLTLKIEFNQIENVDSLLNNIDWKLEMFTMKFNKIDEKIVEVVEENNQKVYQLRQEANQEQMEELKLWE